MVRSGLETVTVPWVGLGDGRRCQGWAMVGTQWWCREWELFPCPSLLAKIKPSNSSKFDEKMLGIGVKDLEKDLLIGIASEFHPNFWAWRPEFPTVCNGWRHPSLRS